MTPLAAIDESTFNLRQSVGTPFSPIVNYSVPQIIVAALNLLFVASAIGAFFYLLIGGIQWITAGGEKESLEKARKKITQALIGLAIVFSVYAAGFLIQNIFDVNIFNLCIPSIAGGCSSGGSSSKAFECLCAYPDGSRKSCETPCFSKPDGSYNFCYNQPVSGSIQKVGCERGRGFVVE